MISKIFIATVLGALACAEYHLPNPKVNLANETRVAKAGETISVTWTNASTGFVEVDVQCVDSVNRPASVIFLASVPAASGQYDWKIPTGFAPSKRCNLLVWGAVQPGLDGTENGKSEPFELINESPDAVTSFAVLTPNGQTGCNWGKECTITWNYNEHDVMHPAKVDISVYATDSPYPLFFLAQAVESSKHSFTWNVPEEHGSETADLIRGRQIYISVTGMGTPVSAPSKSSSMGGTSSEFTVTEFVEPKVEETHHDETGNVENPESKTENESESGKLKHLSSSNATRAVTSGLFVVVAVLAYLF